MLRRSITLTNDEKKLFPTPETAERYHERAPNTGLTSQCIEAGMRSKLFASLLEPFRYVFDLPCTFNVLRGLPRVFDALLKTLATHTCVTHRPHGVAFLSAAKELYGLAAVSYACTNIPILQGERRFSHCV